MVCHVQGRMAHLSLHIKWAIRPLLVGGRQPFAGARGVLALSFLPAAGGAKREFVTALAS